MSGRLATQARDTIPFIFTKLPVHDATPKDNSCQAQLEFNAILATAAKQPLDYSMMLSAQYSHEQTILDERVQQLLQELTIDIVVAPDAAKNEIVEIVIAPAAAFD